MIIQTHTNSAKNLKVFYLCLLSLGITPLTALGAGFRSPDVFFMGAAQASDASTEYYNPAGLALLDRKQFVTAGTAAVGNIKFEGLETRTVKPSNHHLHQSGSARSPINGITPLGFYAQPIAPGLTAAIGAYEPFGLSGVTEFPNDSNMAFIATKRDLRAYNFSAGLGYRPVNWISFGAGADFQQLYLIQNNIINPVFGKFGQFQNEGDSSAFGWHAGLLVFPTSTTRVGLSFRSEMHHTIKGTSDVIGLTPPPVVIPSFDMRSNINLPANVLFSVAQTLPKDWAMNFNAEWTGWNCFKTLTLQNVAHANGMPTSYSAPQNYNNTWRFILSAAKLVSTNLKLQAGIGYDQGVNSAPYTTPALPDGYKINAGIGLSYDISRNSSVVANYVHPFFESVNIDYTNPAGVHYEGVGSRNADAIGLKWVLRFGAEVA